MKFGDVKFGDVIKQIESYLSTRNSDDIESSDHVENSPNNSYNYHDADRGGLEYEGELGRMAAETLEWKDQQWMKEYKVRQSGTT